ncbi:MAG: twin-arginine translocation signal domain-containing protein [Candidatus Moduliflexus flocculans]|nr:twin-arginine translocation signal domain-containing protein [Candidatus Moduliflexus flocculans]
MAKNGSTSTRRDFIKAAGWGAAAASLAPLGAAGEPGPGRAGVGEGRRFQAQVRPRHRRVRHAREEPGRSAQVHRRPGLHGLVRQRPDGPARGRTGEAGRGIGAAGARHRPLRRSTPISPSSRFVIKDEAVNDMLDRRFGTAVETGKRTGCR